MDEKREGIEKRKREEREKKLFLRSHK